MKNISRNNKSCALSKYLAAVLVLVIILSLVTSSGCFTKAYTYDYTDRVSNIESICYVRIKQIETYAQGDESDVFDYEVISTLDSDPAETILKDLAALKYRRPVFGHPYFVDADTRGILLKFKNDSSDPVYVLYCRYGYAVVNECDRGLSVENYGPCCDEKQWTQLFNKYVS